MMPLMPMINRVIAQTGLLCPEVSNSSCISPARPAAVIAIDASYAPLLLQRPYNSAAMNTVGIAIRADAPSSSLETVML